MGVLESPGKVLDFMVSERVGSLLTWIFICWHHFLQCRLIAADVSLPWSVVCIITLVHRAKSAGVNEMPLGMDTPAAPNNILLKGHLDPSW